MSIKATVIVPTFDHVDTLLYSIPSALNQTVKEIEVFVIGDGVPERTREIMREFISQDERVRFLDYPKTVRQGEEYRHKVLAEYASGEIVCYLCDDDLWLPNHVEAMHRLLQTCDMTNTMPLVCEKQGEIKVLPVDLSCVEYHDLFLSGVNRVPLSFFAHTLSFYHRLPFGWRTAPQLIPSDLYMYQQFLQHPACRALSGRAITGLHFASPKLAHMSVQERLLDLESWAVKFRQPGAHSLLLEAVSSHLFDEVVSKELIIKRSQARSLEKV